MISLINRLILCVDQFVDKYVFIDIFIIDEKGVNDIVDQQAKS